MKGLDGRIERAKTLLRAAVESLSMLPSLSDSHGGLWRDRLWPIYVNVEHALVLIKFELNIEEPQWMRKKSGQLDFSESIARVRKELTVALDSMTGGETREAWTRARRAKLELASLLQRLSRC